MAADDRGSWTGGPPAHPGSGLHPRGAAGAPGWNSHGLASAEIGDRTTPRATACGVATAAAEVQRPKEARGRHTKPGCLSDHGGACRSARPKHARQSARSPRERPSGAIGACPALDHLDLLRSGQPLEDINRGIVDRLSAIREFWLRPSCVSHREVPRHRPRPASIRQAVWLTLSAGDDAYEQHSSVIR